MTNLDSILKSRHIALSTKVHLVKAMAFKSFISSVVNSNIILSWWRDLTDCGPLEKGMANHFSILALRTP